MFLLRLSSYFFGGSMAFFTTLFQPYRPQDRCDYGEVWLC